MGLAAEGCSEVGQRLTAEHMEYTEGEETGLRLGA